MIVWLVEWRWFQFFIFAIVIANSVLQITNDYAYRVDFRQQEQSEASKTVSVVFISIFLVEFVLKVIAMGFILKKNSYLRTPINYIDFICVIVGILELTSWNVESFMILRILKVLKPLRSVKAVPQLQLLIKSLVESLYGLANVYLFLVFILALFSIFGVNMFAGFQYRACRTGPELLSAADGTPYWPKADVPTLCSSDAMCQEFVSGSVCGSTWEEFGLDPWKVDNVLENDKLFYGVPGFDDFGMSLLTVFQVCTLEGWSHLMYNYIDSANYPIWAYLTFPILILIGSFFTMNLILA